MSITNQIIERLILSAKYSEGYFLTNAVARNLKEQNIFFRLVSRNPDWFKKVYSGEGNIFQLTKTFAVYETNSVRDYEMRLKSLREILQMVLWNSYILQHDKRQTIQEFYDAETDIFLDNFFCHFYRPEDHVITFQFRQLECIKVVPTNLKGGKTNSFLKQIFISRLVEGDQLLIPTLMKSNQLEGAYLEGEVERHHIRPQEYSFLEEPITGPAKLREDQKIVKMLNEGKFSLNYKPYKFGAYPYISRNREVSNEEFS